MHIQKYLAVSQRKESFYTDCEVYWLVACDGVQFFTQVATMRRYNMSAKLQNVTAFETVDFTLRQIPLSKPLPH